MKSQKTTKKLMPSKLNAMKIIQPSSSLPFIPFALSLILILCNAGCQSSGEHDSARNQTTVKSGRVAARFEVREGELVGQKLVNLTTGFNWLAPDSPVGPWCLSGNDTAWPDHLRIVNKSRGLTAQGREEWKAEWAISEGPKLNWTVGSFPETSVLEFQARLRNDGNQPINKVHEFGPLRLCLRGDAGKLKVHWVRRDTYKRHEVILKDSFTVSGGSWNAPESSGWVAIENVDTKEILFLGVKWESYWRVTLRRQGAQVLLECTLERFDRDLMPGKEMLSPRVFLGLSHGDIDDSLRDMHDHLRQNVIPAKLPNYPWVTYNIWGTAGDGSNEKAILDEIPLTAGLGIELFYVDASWYEGSCTNGSGDWFPGLGNWHREDFRKYPHGLGNISEKVHQAGMKFGLWFAPQMVDSTLIGGRIPDSWVAKRDGKNLVTGTISQICLGDPKVVQFLKDSIESAVKRYDLNWVKMDGSGLPGIVCNRKDHGHQEGDGALAAIQGEYEVYQYLHQKFPDVVIEQCGYGSRLDYGLARYMRANWLDDSSGDAMPVRRRIINGTYVYPSPYLETWVYKGPETDKEKDPDILNTTIRSRMIGAFGFGCLINSPQGVERLSLYPPETIKAVRRNIADYKKYRHLLFEDVYHFPPASDDANLGDAIQFCKRDGSESVVMVFQNGNAYDAPNPTPFDDSSLADVVHSKNITGTSGDSQWGFVAQGTCNGAGLDFGTGLRHGTGLKDMWLGSAGGGAAPHPGTAKGANWIAYAFDKPYPLGKTWVWNWNNEGAGNATGLNHVTIEYSETGGADPGKWKKLDDFQFKKATGAPKYAGFAGPDFAGASAKYVVITVHPLTGDMATSGTWGAGDCGLSEVRFYLNTETAIMAVEKMAAAKSSAGSARPALERTIMLRGLKADAHYTLTSLNTGRSEKAGGAQLMSEGVKTSFAKAGMSEILLLKRD
ncbi:MAG: alpha-galactosidase [Verrucomicrobia bacterium]|nr:alpha-galactosidase [Verrucomicrobiota bacterium]